MNVGFEAKRFFHNFTGLGNYSRFVVEALSEFAPQNQHFLFSPRLRNHPEVNDLLARPNISAVGPAGFYKFFPGAWRSFGMSSHPSMTNLDLFHGLSQELPLGLPARIRKVVTVHDLIFLRYPQYYNRIDVAIYTRKVRAACSMADRVVAISNQTAQDLVDLLGVDAAKIAVIYQGTHKIFRQPISEEATKSVGRKYLLPDRFLLNVGTVEERKNVALLVEALALLPPALRLPLVIVGRATKYKEHVLRVAEKLGVAEFVTFLHNVSFQDLPALYRRAEVFVYPSLFEGFGIPLVEAMECGVPVISSKGSCFTEAAGPGSLYVDPHSAAELASVLSNVLASEQLRSEMVSASRAYIQQFQPSVIARNMVAEYKTLLG